jgi:hypothetical protein
MDFLSQTFNFSTFYHMIKIVFESISYNYYKGLKNKLPPIRFIGTDFDNNELIILAHPKDFVKHILIFKNSYNYVLQSQEYKNVKISDVKDEILEIYPNTKELLNVPNGFTGFFVNSVGMEIVKSEFNNNEEVGNLHFIQVTDNGININNIKLCGVIETFIRKFNKKPQLKNKYKYLYLVVGEMKDINIITGETISTNKYNIFGGKRLYDETCINSTIRETQEELGLTSESKILKLINILIPKTKDIIKCSSFNVFCIYFCPKIETIYDYPIKFNKILLQNNQ